MKPLWSCRQTVEVISRLSEETSRAPGQLSRLLQPFGVLVEHRIDDVDERLVGREEAVPAGQQIAFEPALQRVLAEHLHDPAVGRQLAAVGVLGEVLAQPGLLGHLVDRGQPVRGVLVGAEDAEVVRVVAHDVAQELAQQLGRPDLDPSLAAPSSTA